MLKQVEVRTAAGTLLTLPLEGVTNGLYIDDIRGLDPVKATLVSSTFANIDGSQYQSSRRESRNIIFTISLDPDYSTDTVRALRYRLYQFLMPKTQVRLTFVHDEAENNLDVTIVGRVESLETALFSKDPSVDISIMCFDPDFVDDVVVNLTGNTVEDTTETTITYVGTVEAGILFTLNLNRVETQFTIYHTLPDNSVRQFDVAANFLSGDVVTINMVAGNKYLTLLRSSTQSSLLYAKSPQSPWIELEQGVNKIRVYATGAAIPYTIAYQTRYGGL